MVIPLIVLSVVAVCGIGVFIWALNDYAKPMPGGERITDKRCRVHVPMYDPAGDGFVCKCGKWL